MVLDRHSGEHDKSTKHLYRAKSAALQVIRISIHPVCLPLRLVLTTSLLSAPAFLEYAASIICHDSYQPGVSKSSKLLKMLAGRGTGTMSFRLKVSLLWIFIRPGAAR